MELNPDATALRNVESFVEFKSFIKNWKPSNCMPFTSCRVKTSCIPQVGFCKSNTAAGN